jgi:DNA helicase HerA-like ATPase
MSLEIAIYQVIILRIKKMFTLRQAKFNMIPSIAFCGKSGSGKTYGALLFARGYVGKNGKIGVICTENGRAECYAGDPLIGDFFIIVLDAPFTPERYIEAYNEMFEFVGADGIIIVDSGSHEWEGDGGTLEFVEEQGAKNNSAGKWNKPKQRRKKFVSLIASPPVATIICFRIKDRLIDVRDPSKGTVEEIVTEKNFRFELSVIVKFEVESHIMTFTKAPKPLHDIIHNGVIMTRELGEKFCKKMKGIVEPKKTIEEISIDISKAITIDALKVIANQYSKHEDFENIKTALTARKEYLQQPQVDKVNDALLKKD